MRSFTQAVLAAGAVAALVLGPSRAAAQSTLAPERLTAIQQDAIASYRAGRYERAARRYQELVTLQPENVGFLKDLMWVLWRAERLDEAANAARQVTVRQPGDLEAWNLLGNVLTTLGKPQEALAAFEHSLRVDPEQLRVWGSVARLYLDVEDYAKAEELMTRLLQRYPDSGDFYPVLARAQSAQGKFAEAARTWAAARTFFPEELAYIYQAAESQYQSGQAAEAMGTLHALVAAHAPRRAAPEQVRIWRGVARLYLDLDEPAKAEELLRTLLARYRDAGDLYPMLARAQTAQGHFADAAQNWAKARKYFPDELTYVYQEAAACSQSGQEKKALFLLDQMVARRQEQLLAPDQLGVSRSVAKLYLDLGQPERAVRFLTQLLERYPEEGSLYPVLARAQHQQGAFGEAADTWAKARTYFPNELAYAYQEAASRYQNGQTDQAVALLNAMAKEHPPAKAKPEDLRVWRAVAQLHFDLRRYADAETLLTTLLEHYPDYGDFYPMLARSQTVQEHFNDAAQSWEKARAFFPDELGHAYQEALARYQNGQTDEAVTTLQALAVQHPEYRPAINLLVDHATVQEDWAGAARLLELHLTDPKPGDAAQVLKLATMYRRLGKTDAFLSMVDRSLQLDPNQAEAWMQKADYFKSRGQWAAAADAYQHLLRGNPWSLKAMIGLADVQYLRGRYREAIRLIERARRFDPTDPYLLIVHARYLYSAGNLQAAATLLTRWAEANRGPVLPVLLYHGLATTPDSAMLASPVHMTVQAFEEQIRALHEAGFTPVTADDVDLWYQGKRELPEHPVLITFDDARLDSFQRADPILARYNFKATMFVPITNIERDLPGYASWDELASYRQTGRWELQSHGGDASKHIRVDADGRDGLFLASRQWLEAEQRMETPREWRTRIAADYAQSQRSIEQHLQTTPMVFAYPESNFGQEGMPNVEDSAPINIELASRTYRVLFHQDSYGLNVRSKQPAFLTRLEPPATWSGADLLRHIAHQNPFVMAHVSLLRQAAWQGRIREARQWLAQLQQDGVSESYQLIEQARIFYTAGDPQQGRALMQQALQSNQASPDVVKIAQDIQKGDSRWVWSPSFWFEEDSNDRQGVIAEQSFGTVPTGPVVWHVNHRSGLFSEPGVADVTGHGVGVGVTGHLGLFHQWQASLMGHAFSGGDAGGAVSGSAALTSHWTDDVTTRLEAGSSPIETARALNANVQDRYVLLRTGWDGTGPWAASLQGRASSLSDDNQRFTAVFEASRRLVEFLPAAQLMYRLTADDTQEISRNYYSPQGLLLNQLGVEYELLRLRHVGLSLRYLPGVGAESGAPATFIHSVEVEAPFYWDGRPWLRPVFFLTKTPTYESHRLGVLMRFLF